MDSEKRDDVSSTIWGIRGFRVVSAQVEDSEWGEDILVVQLENESGEHTCPTCGKRDANQRRLAFQEELPRRWRDCSLGAHETYVEIVPWRLFCCGSTRVESFDWASPGHRMTRRFFERIAALCTRLPIQEVAGMAALAWDTVARIDKEATRLALGGDRPPIGKPRWLGIDEVSRTGGHVYFTIVTDLDSGRVLYVGDGKGEEGLEPFFLELGRKGCRGIRGVVSDLSSSYLPVIARHLPRVIHVLDRFHIVQWLNEALNKVRRRVFGAAPKDELGQELKIKKWLLLTAYENLSHSDKLLLGRLAQANEPIFFGHLLKEQLRGILRHSWRYLKSFRKNFAAWVQAVADAGLPEFATVAVRLTTHLAKIEAGFNCGVRLGFVEATNGIIGDIRRKARGLRDPEYYKFKIYQRCSLPNNPYAQIIL